MVEPATPEKLKLFISYSRRDVGFAERLVDALKARAFEVKIDRRDLPKLEDWQRELLHFIRQADTIVFIVSESSLASPVVAWEVEQVRLNGKRLAPVVISDVSGLAIPSEVSRINYIYFTEADQFDRGIDELARALNADVVWLKEHTRIGDLACRWDEHRRVEDALVRGEELARAEAWAGHHPSGAPAVTRMQREFLVASRLAEDVRLAREARQKRWRRQMQTSLALVLVAGLGYGGWSNRPYLRARIADLIELFEARALSAGAERALKPLDGFSECAVCPHMVVVPAGEFMMGSPASDRGHKADEEPIHRVTILKPFAISKFEITFEQWDACVALGGCTYEPDELGFGRGSQPVINIGWRDAKQYAAWLARRTGKPYRLLSEAEWEYAARAGSRTAFPWGEAIGRNNANCQDCGSHWDNRRTAPVGSFAPNAFGLHDMHGNVWEWVEDCWHQDYQSAPVDGSAWTTACADDALRVLRGGSWDDEPKDLRSAVRYGPGVSARTRVNGIRIGRDLRQ